MLLLVLAVDAAIRACQTGHVRSPFGAGVLVGFAFQAKMLQAWLVLPALLPRLSRGCAGGLVPAPGTTWRRRASPRPPSPSVGCRRSPSSRSPAAPMSMGVATTRSSRRCSPTTGSAASALRTRRCWVRNCTSRLDLVTYTHYAIRHGVGTGGIAASWDWLLRPLFARRRLVLLPAVVAAVWSKYADGRVPTCCEPA